MTDNDTIKRLEGILRLSHEVEDGNFSMQVLRDEIVDVIVALNNDLPKPPETKIGDVKGHDEEGDFGVWFDCDGRPLSKAKYPELYKVCKGVNMETENYFCIPDLTGGYPHYKIKVKEEEE